MQTVFTIVFLAFICGSLCDVVSALLHSPGSKVRMKRSGHRKRSIMKRARSIERYRRDIPMAAQ